MTIPAAAPTPDRFTARAWAMLLVLCGVVFLEGIDLSMMGVALPSMRADLDMSTTALQWVVSAYALGYGGFVLLGGRAADLLGRRRMFVAALAVFIAFSGLGGLSSEGWMLIVARFVTGVSAGFLTPAALSIITTTFAEGAVRNRALLVYAGIAAGGVSLGMVVGGLLTALSWRWVFFAPVLAATPLLPLALRLVPAGEPPARDGRGFDVAGALSITGGMLLAVYTVVMAPEVRVAETAATALAAAALLAAFAAIERRSAAPLVRLGILRSVPLVRANVSAAVLVGSYMAFQFVVVLYLQQVRGWSSVETGLALTVVGLDAILAPTLTPPLVARFGTARVIGAGFAIAILAYALFLPLGLDWTYWAMLPTMALIGVAFALAYGPLTIAATDGVDDAEQGLAGGLLNVSMQFGAALGLAVATAIAVAATDGASAQAQLDGFRAALVVPVAAAAIGAVATATGVLTRRRVADRTSASRLSPR